VCTLALYFRHFHDYPLVVAANRDELYERPASPPAAISHDPWVVAGQDLVAGGTWLGLNETGMVVGLLNRRGPSGEAFVDPTRRSRGLLALEMLQCPSLELALEQLHADRGDRYNGFNLLLATAEKAYVAHNANQAIGLTELDPGVHLLTNLELNDPTCPRIAKSARLFQQVCLPPGAKAEALVRRLQAILSDHSTPLDPRSELPPNNLCVHTPRFGTCSASILACQRATGHFLYWHAAGAPCATPFEEVPLPNSS
jgi:uncharacterized protein with NRDE domain